MWCGIRPSRERNTGDAHRQGRSTGRTSLPVLDLTLMRPPVVKRQTTPMSGFFAFFRFFLVPSSLGHVS